MLLLLELTRKGGKGGGGGEEGGVLPYIGYMGMCGPKVYGFSAVLLINRLLMLAVRITCG